MRVAPSSTLRAPSIATEVLAGLPVLLVRALDGPEVTRVLDELVVAGWRPGQLGARIGAEPAQGSPERDAAHVLALLRGLQTQTPPDVAHAREVERRERDRERRDGPVSASPEVRSRAVAQIRSELKGVPARRPQPVPRTRPACSLCDGEGSYFVTREVHLCRRCVQHLASGEARLSSAG